MRSVLAFAAFAIVAGMIVPRYASQMNAAPAATPNVMAAARPDPAASSSASGAGSVTVPPDAYGHFRVEGRIDGRHLDFMIDTGASVIALTADDAASLGIHPAPSEFRGLVRTANGNVRAAPIKLDMVEIGDLMVRDVSALVMPEGALSENLLGLSFLSRLRHFEYTEGKMVLEQ